MNTLKKVFRDSLAYAHKTIERQDREMHHLIDQYEAKMEREA